MNSQTSDGEQSKISYQYIEEKRGALHVSPQPPSPSPQMMPMMPMMHNRVSLTRGLEEGGSASLPSLNSYIIYPQ